MAPVCLTQSILSCSHTVSGATVSELLYIAVVLSTCPLVFVTCHLLADLPWLSVFVFLWRQCWHLFCNSVCFRTMVTHWLYLSAPCCCCFCWWCGWYWCSWLWLMTTMVATSEKLCLCRWFSPSRLWSSKSLWYHNLLPRERAWPNSLCSRPAERPLQVGLVCLCGNWVDLLEFQLKASLSAMVLSLHISLFQISFSFMTGLWYCQRDRRLLI